MQTLQLVRSSLVLVSFFGAIGEANAQSAAPFPPPGLSPDVKEVLLSASSPAGSRPWTGCRRLPFYLYVIAARSNQHVGGYMRLARPSEHTHLDGILRQNAAEERPS
jgi:hypothetical protein